MALKLGDRRRRGGAVGCSGARAKFLLSGLMTCGRCGSRYEGRINYGPQPKDESRERQRTYVYGCGGYIRHGKSHCEFGPVKKEVLEEAVINAIIEFYKQYTGPDGKRKIAEALNFQIVEDQSEIERQRASLERELEGIEKITRKLLDNITPGNREMVNGRLEELQVEREQVQKQLDLITAVEANADEHAARIEEIVATITGMEAKLRRGSTEEAQGMLRGCVRSAEVLDDPSRLVLSMAVLPAEARTVPIAIAVHPM